MTSRASVCVVTQAAGALDTRPHRARVERGRVHPQPHARRRRTEARRVRGSLRAGDARAARRGEALRSLDYVSAPPRSRHRVEAA